jgi:hypothetical protein
MGIRIGFVDSKLENYHANVFLKAYRDALKQRAATVAGCTALNVDNGKAWAAHNDVPWYATPAALNEDVDAFLILAPSNPELHLQLAEMVLPLKKPTYIDKTFAPDLATAKKIFALADQHKTPVQTTSALRYTNVQPSVKRDEIKHMITWGGGSSFGEYAIHPVELLISCMGPEATELMRRGSGDYSQLLINFSGGRTGVANIYTHGDTPFAASVTTEKETKLINVETSKIFVNTAAAVLDLFESKKPNVDGAETLIIRRILDTAEDPAALKSFIKL